MNNIDFREIDITFRYETYLSSDKDEKIFKDYNIIKNGLFNHYNLNGDDIRNINFYNYYDKHPDKEGTTYMDLSSTLINHNGNIKLPFTSNYITLDNINYVVTNETEKKKITLDDILKEPDKYQDLLKNKTFKEIPEFFSSTYLKKYNENTKDHFDKFFGRKYGEHKEEFIRTYSYQEFFETYKNDDKRELFNLYIKADGKLPIENKLINNINENCKR